MRKKNLINWGALLVFLVSTVLFMHFYIFIPNVRSRVVKDFRKPFNASCQVETAGNQYGTGVLLDTGYIISAAHVVDDNRNNKMDPGERRVKLSFYGDNEYQKFDGRVVYYSSKVDFVIIEADLPEYIDAIQVNDVCPDIGSSVFTIGATHGQPPMISSGYIGEQDGSSFRTSCYVSGGNSGGGLFNNTVNPRLVGIINTVSISSRNMRISIPIPTQDGIMFIQGNFSIVSELNGISGFIPIENIYGDLESKNLLVLIKKEEPPNTIGPHYVDFIKKTSLQIALVLLCVWILRKQIFST